jgi:hypothetical protein
MNWYSRFRKLSAIAFAALMVLDIDRATAVLAHSRVTQHALHRLG